MRIGIEFADGNGSATFIGLSSWVCDGLKIRSSRFYLLDPEVHMCWRECIFPIMVSETFDDLDPWHAFIREEFDDIALFRFHDFDTFCPLNPLLLAKFAR
jgi:hypothetical protein